MNPEVASLALLPSEDCVVLRSLAIVMVVVIAGACDDGPAPAPESTAVSTSLARTSTSGPTGEIWRPAPGTTWQWQLTGPIDTSYDVDMYDIDLFEAPQSVIDRLHEDGRIVICYFSAGSLEEGRPDSGRFADEVIGNTVEDWPDERWLDISRIDLLAPIMEARLDLAVDKRCDGVEPDLVEAHDASTRFSLTYQDQLDYNRWLADRAHERGLSIGLKNDLTQIDDLVEFFDWALNEECFQYDECEMLLPFVDAGKAVFGVEYRGEPAEYCPRAMTFGFSWLTKTIDLGPEPPNACS
jgi:hypothetical protein